MRLMILHDDQYAVPYVLGVGEPNYPSSVFGIPETHLTMP